MFSAVTGDPSRDYLAPLGGEQSEHFGVFIINSKVAVRTEPAYLSPVIRRSSMSVVLLLKRHF